MFLIFAVVLFVDSMQKEPTLVTYESGRFGGNIHFEVDVADDIYLQSSFWPKPVQNLHGFLKNAGRSRTSTYISLKFRKHFYSWKHLGSLLIRIL